MDDIADQTVSVHSSENGIADAENAITNSLPPQSTPQVAFGMYGPANSSTIFNVPRNREHSKRINEM